VVCESKQSIALFAKIPKEWSDSFKINFRNQVITVSVNHQETHSDGESALEIVLNDNPIKNPKAVTV
jgi:maltose phosphorylase